MENFGMIFVIIDRYFSKSKSRMGRARGDEVRTLVHRPDTFGPEEWKDIKYMIFDCLPAHPGNSSFEERMQTVTKWLEQKRQNERPLLFYGTGGFPMQTNVELIESVKCTGFDHLHSMLLTVLEKVVNLIHQ
jgi:hypothetical protein